MTLDCGSPRLRFNAVAIQMKKKAETFKKMDLQSRQRLGAGYSSLTVG